MLWLYLPLVPFSLDLAPEHADHVPLHVDDGGEAVFCHDLAKLGVLVPSHSKTRAQTFFW